MPGLTPTVDPAIDRRRRNALRRRHADRQPRRFEPPLHRGPARAPTSSPARTRAPRARCSRTTASPRARSRCTRTTSAPRPKAAARAARGQRRRAGERRRARRRFGPRRAAGGRARTARACAWCPVPGPNAATAAYSAARLRRRRLAVRGLPAGQGARRKALDGAGRSLAGDPLRGAAPRRANPCGPARALRAGARRGDRARDHQELRGSRAHAARRGARLARGGPAPAAGRIRAGPRPGRGRNAPSVREAERVLGILLEDCRPSEAARSRRSITGAPRNELYALALERVKYASEQPRIIGAMDRAHDHAPRRLAPAPARRRRAGRRCSPTRRGSSRAPSSCRT